MIAKMNMHGVSTESPTCFAQYVLLVCAVNIKADLVSLQQTVILLVAVGVPMRLKAQTLGEEDRHNNLPTKTKSNLEGKLLSFP